MKSVLLVIRVMPSLEINSILLQYVGDDGTIRRANSVADAQRAITESRPDEVFIDNDGHGYDGLPTYDALRDAIGDTPVRIMAESWPDRDVTRSLELRGIPYGQYSELAPAPSAPAVSS